LRVYRMRFPQVELILRDLVTIEQMQELTVNRLDSSFATHASIAITSLEQERLVQEPIGQEPMVALLPRNHALAGHSAISLADLAHEDWIWFARPYDPVTYDYMMRLFEQVGFRPNVTQEINQQQIILSLVIAGFGVSIAPRSISAQCGERVVCIDLVDPTPVVEFNIVWRRNDGSPILQAFLDIVREVAEAYRW
jgi:DNA-binding transcriptional LysR family regulator